MPFELPLPPSLGKVRWKVKIREKESREPPHVTILRGINAWRINLRTGEFMDQEPDPSDVPEELIAHVKPAANWQWLCDEWEYPTNPVHRRDDTTEA